MLRPNRDTRPLPQGTAISCGGGLASRLGCNAAPGFRVLHRPGIDSGLRAFNQGYLCHVVFPPSYPASG
ncbi:hypothetical protein DM807_08685 [Pseudomonas hunanensis]|nr:hypothetical protein [Pseudomonas hunanensis]RNF75488.1 hypothetical protein EFJ98_03800 [Pseudomonas putida]